MPKGKNRNKTGKADIYKATVINEDHRRTMAINGCNSMEKPKYIK